MLACILCGCDYIDNVRGIGFGVLMNALIKNKNIYDFIEGHIDKMIERHGN